MVKRAIGGVERDYLLLEYRGDDKLYVPSDQIDAVRHYTGGDSPTPQPPRRRRLAEGQGQGAVRGRRDRPGARGALPEAGAHARATPSPRTRRGSASSRSRSPSRRRPTSSRPSTRSRPTWRPSRPMDRLVCGDVGFGKTEVAHPGRVQGGAGRQAGRGARAHHAARPAALPDLQRPLRRLPGPGRGAQPLPHHRPGQEGHRGRARPARSTSSSAPTACSSDDVDVQGPRPARRRRGAALRRAATRRRSSSSRPTSTCSRSPPRPSRARSR